MRSDRGKPGPQKARDRKPPTEYVIGTDSDLGYAKASRRRVAEQKRRRWVIRIAMLAVLGFVAWLWGDDVWYAVRSRTSATAQGFKRTGDYLRKTRDERSGANFEENAPDQRTPPAPSDSSGME